MPRLACSVLVARDERLRRRPPFYAAVDDVCVGPRQGEPVGPGVQDGPAVWVGEVELDHFNETLVGDGAVRAAADVY